MAFVYMPDRGQTETDTEENEKVSLYTVGEIPVMLRLKQTLYLLNVGAKAFVYFGQVPDGITGMKDSGVITVSHLNTDLGKRQLGVFLDEEHGYLTRLYDFSFSGSRLNQIPFYVVEVADCLLNFLYSNLFLLETDILLHNAACQSNVNFTVVDDGVSH